MTSAAGGEFWEKKPVESKPRRRGRRRLIVFACVVGAVLLLVAVAPTVAGWVAPGFVESALAQGVNGTAKVERVSLSWFGGQRAGPIIVSDASGMEVARVQADVSTSLLGLLGGLDLGEVRVSGSAHVVREADGTLNLQKVFPPQPAPPPAAGETRLPSSLKARLLIEDVNVVFEDRTPGAGGAVKVGNVHGRGAFAVGGPLTIDVSADTWHGPSLAGATTPGGSVTIAAEVNGLTTSSGLIRAEAATVDASVDAKALSSAVADIAAGMSGKLAEAFGPSVTLAAKAGGSMQDATASMVMSSPGASADASVRYAKSTGGATVSLIKPATLRAKTAGFVSLAPGLSEAMVARQDEIELTQWPEVTVTLEQFRMTLPESGPPDLRKAAVGLNVQTTEMAGRVLAPGQEAKQEFRVAPLTLSVAGELGSLVKVKADTSVTLDGEPAGTLAVDLSAGGLLDGAGQFRAVVPAALSGSASLSGVTTAIAQPFLTRSGVDLGTDVGPTLGLTLAASSAGGEADPHTNLSLQVVSENIRTVLFATARGTTIVSRDKGLEVRAADLGPLLERLGKTVGLTVDKGGAVVVSSPEFSVDTTRIAAGDYRGLAATLRFGAPTANGTVILRPGEKPQPWSLAPTSITVDAKDLTKGATVTAGTSANLNGQPAGTLEANLVIGGLLNATGGLNTMPTAPSGTAEITGVSTAIAQPWAAAAGLDLPQDIGPRLDVKLWGSAGTGEGGKPVTLVGLTATGTNLSAVVEFTLDEGGLHGHDTAKGPGFDVTLRNAGALAARLAKSPKSAPGGDMRLSVEGLNLPLLDGAARLDQAAGRARVTVSGLAMELPAQGGAERVEIVALNLGATLAPGAPARVTVNSQMSRGGAPFTATGDLSIAGLFGADGSIAPDPAAIRPIGSIELTGLPTALVGLVAAPQTAQLVQEALGPAVSVTFTSAKAAVGEALDLRAGVTSRGANVRLVAGLTAGRLDIGRLEGYVALTPTLLEQALVTYAPTMEPLPRLRAPATAQLSISPTRIPFGAGFAPDYAKAGDLSLRLAVRDPVVLEGFAAEGQAGPGPAGIRGFEMLATVSLAAALGNAEGPAEVTIKGALVGADAEAGDLAIHAKTTLAAGRPSGALESTVKITRFATALADTFTGSPGMVSGAVGPWATIDAGISGTFTPDQDGAMRPDLKFRADVASPLLSTTRPFSGTVKNGVLALDGATVLAWKMDPAWATTWVLAQAPADAKAPPLTRFAAPTDVTLSIFRLAVPTSGPPMRPGVFRFDLSTDAPTVALASADGTQTRFESFKLRATGGGEGQDPGVIGLSIRMNNPGGEQGSAMSLAGGIYQLTDAEGNLTTEAAAITLRGGAGTFPTALVDALARQNGVLVEALGRTVSLDLDATGLNRQGGTIALKAKSPRASVDLKGGVRDGAFRAAGAVQGELLEITPEFGSMLVKGLPAVATFQKQKEDGPATLTATNVTAPVDGDLRKLNGDVVIELGTVRFDTSNVFSKLLKVAGQKQAGSLGKNVEPLRLTIRSGVVTYDRYRIPLGEFTVLARGEVNLVDRTLDVVTYVPLGALTDEVAGVFNTGLGKTLGRVLPPLERVTMVPIRTKGSFEDPNTNPDVGLFAKEFGKNLLRPDQYLKELFGGG